MTLEQWDKDSILVRFEHIFEYGEDETYSTEATFNLKDIFAHFNIVNIRETTLAANQWLDEATRIKFQEMNPNEIPADTFQMEPIELDIKLDVTKNEINRGANTSERKQRSAPTIIRSTEDDKYLITLQPMEIRTFILYLR